MLSLRVSMFERKSQRRKHGCLLQGTGKVTKSIHNKDMINKHAGMANQAWRPSSLAKTKSMCEEIYQHQ